MILGPTWLYVLVLVIWSCTRIVTQTQCFVIEVMGHGPTPFDALLPAKIR